jgi:hypothetical protein
MSDATPPPKPGAPAPGLNPDLQRRIDAGYSEAEHGSTPMSNISVKSTRPAVWPIIWAVVAAALVLLTVWLIFG